MTNEETDNVVDTLTLRFAGETKEGIAITELRASHVAEVLQGLVGLTSDFDKAGVFNPGGPGGSEVLVRPAKEGSFLIEAVRVLSENWETAASVAGIPSLGTLIWWATRSVRAEVKSFDYLENGNVKVIWQDDTAQEIPSKAWEELQKRKPRRKAQLRQIMTPLSDQTVHSLEVGNPRSDEGDTSSHDMPENFFTLTHADYVAVKPEEHIEESDDLFEVEAQISALDFDNSDKWRVRTKDFSRLASVEDQEFLRQVSEGLAIRKTDIFRLLIRENVTKKNGRTSKVWTVLKVVSHRRAAGDDA